MQQQSILIVEDEAIVALDLKLQLQELGYHVCGIAASGEQALELIASARPHLVLMDVRLQGPMDGIEAAGHIRERFAVPVIFLTAHSDDETVYRAAQTAPYSYLTKPYQIREVRAAIEVAVTKAQMELRLREADHWFAHTLRCVADGVVVTDQAATVRFINPAAEELTGWSASEAIGRRLDDVVRVPPQAGLGDPAHPNEALELIQDVLRNGCPAPVRHGRPLRHRKGSERIIDETAGPVDNDQGQRLGAVLVLRDAAERLAQEAQVRASETRFRALSEAAPLGVFATDAAGACTYTNARWQVIYGLSEAEALGHGWSHTLHPDDKAAVFAQWQQAAAQRREFDMEFRVRHHDGSVRHVRSVARALLDGSGQAVGYVGSVEDITERLQSRRALEEERERLAAIIQGTGAGTWEWNVQSGETRFNERWAEIVGATLEDLTPTTIQTWTDRVHPEDRARSQALLAAHFAGETAHYECEARMRHRQGHWVWVLDRGKVLRRTADGKPEWMFGTHLDVTARKAQEDRLRKSEELLNRTGALAQVGGWEVDLASGSVQWSEETCRIHGVEPGHQPQLGEAIDFYAPTARPIIEAAVAQAMTEGQGWDLELPFIQRGGECMWVRSVGHADVEGGKPVRLFGTLQDISRRHALDQVLAHKTAELKRSNEELERFAYLTSHDLQEPLRMVTSYGQLLTRRHLGDLKPEAQEFVAHMVDGGQRAQTLIRDLLVLARLDSKAKPWAQVNLETTLADALRPLQLRLRETGAQLTHDPLPTVMGDASQLGQLMANLLSNALKFCGQAAPVVHVGAVREGCSWRISVRDNGIGIEPHYFDRIFLMFQRLHQRGEYEGTGIGLAICKKVVERHGGQLSVASSPGQGATFHFTLPDPAPSGLGTADRATEAG